MEVFQSDVIANSKLLAGDCPISMIGGGRPARHLWPLALRQGSVSRDRHHTHRNRSDERNVGQTDERQDRFEVRFEEVEVGKRSAGKKRTVTDRYNNHDRL